MQFDTSFLNKTPNKTPRADQRLEMVVWHETASPNPTSPFGTLKYNLGPKIRSSYNYLVAMDGTIFQYVDEEEWIAWHAGVKSHARGYAGWAVNEHSIGVEIDQKNDGTPATQVQRERIVELMRYFYDKYDIPIDRAYHLAHKEVAPGYKHDPQAYNLDMLVALAAQDHMNGHLSTSAYIVVTDLANVRQGPGTHFPIAGKLTHAEPVLIDTIVEGEPFDGENRWAHLTSGLGFVWVRLLRPA